MSVPSMTEREFLRHVLAVLAYRGGKCLRGAPDGFSGYDTGEGRTPLAILAHMGALLDWTLSMARGEGNWNPRTPEDWPGEVTRFHEGLARLDAFLLSGEPLQAEAARLLQGPLADAMTHVGQLAMARRMAGAPLAGENYFLADMMPGRLGPEQAPPRKPF